MTRLTVHFSGHVQGVGFRYTARNLAAGYKVAGCVENLDDGRVLLEIEGEQDQAQGLVNAITEAMGRFVFDKTVNSSPATGQFGEPGLGRLRIRH